MVQAARDTTDVASSAILYIPSESEVYSALGGWLLTVLPAPFRVRQGQQNRTASPAGPYCVMQMVTSRILSTSGWSYTDTARVVTEIREVTIQVSAFGAGGGDALRQAAGLWRDFYTTDWFAANAPILSPLTAGETRQTGFVNAQDQYEGQWSADFRAQINYRRSIPQQFADEIHVTAIEADQ